MSGNTTYSPNAFLSTYVDRFYTFEASGDTLIELPEVLPGTGLELVFHLKTPLSVSGNHLPSAHTVCPRKAFKFDAVKQASFLSVRFRSGAFRHFTSTPFSALNNRYLSVEELWETPGKELLNTLSRVSTIEGKIAEIELFLIDVFDQHHQKKNDKWDDIIHDLYYHFDENTIPEMAKKANVGLRHFERSFKAQFGITAKEFQKITRFQDVIKNILLSKNPNYLSVVLDNGYFDQSHFIREFKSLTAKTPSEYFTKENFDRHFYHKSIHSAPTNQEKKTS